MNTLPSAKRNCGLTLLLALLILGQRGAGQGFMNLDFESAQIIPTTGSYPNGIDTTNALPGWTVYFGANPQSEITYNNPALGSTFVTLYATNGNQLAGNNSVLLQGGLTASAATISQTGFVPSNTQTLLFYAAGNSSTTPVLDVSLGGQNLTFFAISNGPNYTVYAADISAYAGQTETLAFSALKAPSGYNDWLIDNIQFSSNPLAIPEPTTFALVTLGSLLLLFRRRTIPRSPGA